MYVFVCVIFIRFCKVGAVQELFFNMRMFHCVLFPLCGVTGELHVKVFVPFGIHVNKCRDMSPLLQNLHRLMVCLYCNMSTQFGDLKLKPENCRCIRSVVYQIRTFFPLRINIFY